MKLLYLFTFFFGLGVIGNAQNVNLTVIVKGKNDAIVENANVTVKNIADSSIVATKQTNNTGTVIFVVEKNKKYNYEISSVGYNNAFKGVSVNEQDIKITVALTPKVKKS